MHLVLSGDGLARARRCNALATFIAAGSPPAVAVSTGSRGSAAAAIAARSAWQDVGRLRFILGGRLGRPPPLFAGGGGGWTHDLYISHSDADASFAGFSVGTICVH